MAVLSPQQGLQQTLGGGPLLVEPQAGQHGPGRVLGAAAQLQGLFDLLRLGLEQIFPQVRRALPRIGVQGQGGGGVECAAQADKLGGQVVP